jgi:hypothetical protein
LVLNHKLFMNARFLDFAQKVDVEFTNKSRLEGCSHCRGALHSAAYQRKGRFFNIKLPEDWGTFYSLCCSKEGCRKRVRPPSIRYAGRSPFSIALYLLAELIQSGGSQRTIIALSRELHVSERTIGRWQRFWKRLNKKGRRKQTSQTHAK